MFFDADDIEVRHIQPYQAVKRYICPHCNQPIEPGIGHKVVVPRQAPEDRRHWHTGCWNREERRRSATRPNKRNSRG
jgi:hypothetical protein